MFRWKFKPTQTIAMRQIESVPTCHRSTALTKCRSIPTVTMAFTHLQVCNEAPCILFFVLRCWVDPDEAVVAQNH